PHLTEVPVQGLRPVPVAPRLCQDSRRRFPHYPLHKRFLMTVPGPGQGHLAAPDVGDGSAGVFIGGQLYFPNGGASIFSGTGAPGSNVNGADTPLVGDLYIRTDGGVGSTIYR